MAGYNLAYEAQLETPQKVRCIEGCVILIMRFMSVLLAIMSNIDGL